MGNLPAVVSREECNAARKELLAMEKEVTRVRDRLNAERRRLPMVLMDKPPYPAEILKIRPELRSRTASQA